MKRSLPDQPGIARWTRSPTFMLGVGLTVALTLGLFAGLPIFAAQHAPPQAKDAATYPAFDAHPSDKVTIAADPYDTPSKIEAFRVDYLKYDVLPIRIIVTNAGDRPISLDQVRIHLVPSDGNRVVPSDPEDVERRVSSRDRLGTTVPIGPIRWHRGGGASDEKVEQDFHEYGYSALAVEPHTTRAGFLFYPLDGLGKNPLKGAKLLVRRVADADGKELFYFEVPLDKYLGSTK